MKKGRNKTGNWLLELVISDLNPRDAALSAMSIPGVRLPVTNSSNQSNYLSE
jgi:hypothetical protein